MGQFGHQQIDFMMGELSKIDGRPACGAEWELLYADRRDESYRDPPFTASQLRLGDRPFQCRPDVVLRNTARNTVLVIERKVTVRRQVPDFGWPNNRAQLWCYGWIDAWNDADDVMLWCQFWRRETARLWPQTVQMRAIWQRRDPEFHATNLWYFRQYGGTFG